MRSAQNPVAERVSHDAEQRTPRSSFSRMLLAGALIAGLASCAGAGVKSSKPAAQPKDEAKVEQAAKRESNETIKRPQCTKASKSITRNGVTKIFTVESCEDWDYVERYFDNHEFSAIQQLHLERLPGNRLVNKEIVLGVPNCYSWIVKGESDTFVLLLVPHIASKTGNIDTFIIDTEVPVSDTQKLTLEQSSSDCEWTAKLRNGSRQIGTLKFSENGEVSEDRLVPPLNKE